jgi:hypothetical protein
VSAAEEFIVARMNARSLSPTLSRAAAEALEQLLVQRDGSAFAAWLCAYDPDAFVAYVGEFLGPSRRRDRP